MHEGLDGGGAIVVVQVPEHIRHRRSRLDGPRVGEERAQVLGREAGTGIVEQRRALGLQASGHRLRCGVTRQAPELTEQQLASSRHFHRRRPRRAGVRGTEGREEERDGASAEQAAPRVDEAEVKH